MYFDTSSETLPKTSLQSFTEASSKIPAATVDLMDQRFTFSGAGIYHKSLFEGLDVGVKAPLAPLLKEAMARNQVLGELLDCSWHDVGTPERLKELNQS